jgi:AraC-like DNA-binding protein
MLEGELLSSFAQGDEDYFLPVFKSLDKNQFSRMVHHTTPLMRAILHQIIHCPYGGVARRFYLEGKAMELLSCKLEQLNPSNIHRNSKLKSADYERILHAAEILAGNLENPPNTRMLASSVGLSHSKLHRCFRQVYGVSPFEYLRDHRLQTAMLHLQNGKSSVTEVALRVGYSNLSYFSKAFKATFGVAPGELLHNSSPALCQSPL